MRRRDVALGSHAVVVEHRDDGATRIRASEPLAPYARAMPDRLAHWARERPKRTFLAERTADGARWRTIDYAAMLAAVRATAQTLLDLGCTAEHGIVLLSGNGIDHAIVALAAQWIGVPHAPLSPAYALRASDPARLRACVALVEPAAAFVDDPATFARALACEELARVPLLVSRGTAALHACVTIADATTRTPTPAVDAAFTALAPDSVAKILFTSGSTGLAGIPKGVIVTQRMLCSNQQQGRQAFPFWADGELVMLDWSPWHHTAGANQVFGMVLDNGGTLYVDDGRPVDGAFAATVRNLREIEPTVHFGVPRSYGELVRALGDDAALRGAFFRRLRMMFSGGAAMPAPVFDRLRDLARATTGDEILLTCSLGATETGPSATFANFFHDVAGNIGVPLPGLDVALVPSGEKRELRVRGPNVTPGYLRRPDLTAAAFDERGYFRMGDAVRAVDDRDLSHGFFFDGRLGDDFKLDSGTWVNAARLRAGLLAALTPLATDIVVCGSDRSEVGLLIAGDAAVARTLGADPSLDEPQLWEDEAVRAHVRDALARYAAAHPGSSRHARRAAFLTPAPSPERGELTDKGTLSAVTIRSLRATAIERLHAAHTTTIRIMTDAEQPCGRRFR